MYISYVVLYISYVVLYISYAVLYISYVVVYVYLVRTLSETAMKSHNVFSYLFVGLDHAQNTY